MTNDITPHLTSEALIALSVAYEVPPPPLVLVQLGFDGAASNATSEFTGLVDRGIRVLRALHPALDPSEETRVLIYRCVVAMSQAPVFVVARRSDEAGSHVIYNAEDCVMDIVDGDGNHRLQEIADVASEVRAFFNGYDNASDIRVTCPPNRLAIDAEPSDGEDPLVTQLASEEFPGYLVTVGYPSRGRVEILGWRSTANQLFTMDSDTESDTEEVTFTAITTDAAVSTVMAAIAGIQATDSDRGT